MTAEFARINKTQNTKQRTAKGKQYDNCLGDFSWKFAYYILNIMCTLKRDFAETYQTARNYEPYLEAS